MRGQSIQRKARGILVGMCSGCIGNEMGVQTDRCNECKVGEKYEYKEREWADLKGR